MIIDAIESTQANRKAMCNNKYQNTVCVVINGGG